MTATTHEQDRDARHKARMQRKKALMDGKIAEAQDEYGLLLVHSGNGKGKSSSAFGMLARALGHGMQVAVVQFIKGAASTGEEAFFRRFPEQVRYHVMGEGFTWETQDRQRDIAAAEAAWAVSRQLLQDQITVPTCVLLDINMPVISGFDVAQALSDGLRPQATFKLVMLTSSGSPRDRDRVGEIPVIQGFVTKPLLVDAVRDMLQRD